MRELREQAETSAKEALARELALGRERERELAQATARLTAARDACSVAADRQIDPTELRTHQDYLERRELERVAAAMSAETQAERIEAGRRVLVLAAQEREAVERLRRWQERDHARAAQRAEERQLEDVGLRMRKPFSSPGAA